MMVMMGEKKIGSQTQTSMSQLIIMCEKPQQLNDLNIIMVHCHLSQQQLIHIQDHRVKSNAIRVVLMYCREIHVIL